MPIKTIASAIGCSSSVSFGILNSLHKGIFALFPEQRWFAKI